MVGGMFWIYNMPSWLLAIVTVASFFLVAGGGLVLSRRYITRRLIFSRDINDAVNYFGSALATLYSVTLGLIAVACWQNYSELKNLVSREASTIAVLYRDLGGYPEPLRTDSRRALREYNVAIIEKAWPAQREGILLDSPTQMLTGLHEKILSYRPSDLGTSVMHAEVLRKFNELIDLRRQRVDQVDDGLPLILWVVVAIGGLLTIAVSYFFWIEDIRFHLLLLFMLTTFIALMIYLIASLDRPFRGNVSITADSYELTLKKVMDPMDAAAANPH